MRPSLGELLPACCEWDWGDPREESSPLFAEEAASVARAVSKRQREFAKTRECARRALSRLGVPPAPLLNGPEREPLWPDGIVGSLTHTDTYCAVAIARATECGGLGIDAELAEPLETAIADRITTPHERHWLARSADGALLSRLVFSIKEAVYKCQFPLSRRFLGFADVVVELDDAAHSSGAFTAELQVDAGCFARGHRFAGNWACGADLLLATAWLRADEASKLAGRYHDDEHRSDQRHQK